MMVGGTDATDTGAGEGRRGAAAAAAADPKPRRSPRLKRACAGAVAGAGSGSGSGRASPCEISVSVAKNNNTSNTESCEERKQSVDTTNPKQRCRSRHRRTNDFIQEEHKEPAASSNSQEGCHSKQVSTMSMNNYFNIRRVRGTSEKLPPPSPSRELDAESSSSEEDSDSESGGVKDSDGFHVPRSRRTKHRKGKSPKSKRAPKRYSEDDMNELIRQLHEERQGRLKAEEELRPGPIWSTWMHVDSKFNLEKSRSSATTATPVDSKPKRIEKWDLGAIHDLGNGKVDCSEFDYLNEIINRLQTYTGNARTLPHCNAYITGRTTYIGSSEALVTKSLDGLDEALREALRVAEVPGGDRLHYGVVSVVDHRSDTVRSPDFEYYMLQPGQDTTKANVSSGKCLIVGEIKTTKSLEVRTYKELVDLVEERGSNVNYKKNFGTVACPVTQLCNYMKMKGCKYGILTNHDVTFFVKRVCKGTVGITEAFLTITAEDRESLEAQSNKRKKRRGSFETGNMAMADKYAGMLPPLSLLQATSIFVAIAMKNFQDREKESSATPTLKVLAKRGGKANGMTRYASSQGAKSSTKPSKSIFGGRLRLRRTRSQDPNAADPNDSLANTEVASPALFSGQVEIYIETAQHLLTPVLFSVGAGYKSVSVKSLATGEVEPHCFAKALPLHLNMANSRRGDAERAARQAIDNEAELLLGRAAPLQGKVLPRVVFFGTTTDGLESTYLVTRHEGDSLSSRDGAQRALQVGIREIRRRLHELLNMLHEAGLAHGDVALRNIVINDDNVLHFIDIGMASEDPSSQDMEHEHAVLDLALDDLEYRAGKDESENVQVVGSASASVSEPEAVVTANEIRREEGLGVGAAATNRSVPALKRGASFHGNVRKSLRRLSLRALRSRSTTTVPTDSASDAHESTMHTSD
mmetsp:Transcript_5030/g.10470  ORF Transcript_5030/g.10470 Transcript_5030/m.10470 type:complete len:922 (-) Transcript_5030:1494-4259(-)